MYQPSQFFGNSIPVPHHLVEAIVEVKCGGSGNDGCAQIAAYTYQHLQARPDHPSTYGLVITPQCYQIILSDPTGIIASPQVKWPDLRLLQAYVHSHYYPPDNHPLVDDKVSRETLLVDAPTTWRFNVGGKTYSNGNCIALGAGLGRGTKVFSVKIERRATIEELLIKDYFRHFRRRFKEESILTHIHADGDVPGVVRLDSYAFVPFGGKRLTVGSTSEHTLRERLRLILLDQGESLEKARSVNDLMMCFYDAIEGTSMTFFV